MTDDKTPKTPVSSPDEEPKPSGAKTAGAKPAAKIAHDSVVSGGDTDPIKYSSAKPSLQRKVLTVLHIQRRLVDLGYHEAASSPGGTYDALTQSAVSKYQESLDAPATGVLTRDQFDALFEGDPNVNLSQDTHEDHQV